MIDNVCTLYSEHIVIVPILEEISSAVLQQLYVRCQIVDIFSVSS